jgi:hypothetical protein
MEVVYRFKQKLCYLLLEKGLNQNKCRELAPKLLRMIAELRQQGLQQLLQLGDTLHNWREEIGAVAIHQKQRDHRRIPHKNGSPAAPGLRLQKLQ